MEKSNIDMFPFLIEFSSGHFNEERGKYCICKSWKIKKAMLVCRTCKSVMNLSEVELSKWYNN